MTAGSAASQPSAPPSGAASPPTGAGRPRDERKTPQILRAVLDVIAEAGYQSLRVETVAARAGVSPGSVYRRWPTKLELVVAAFDFSPGAFSVGDPETGDSDFTSLLTDLAERLTEPAHMRLALLAANPDEPQVSRAARQHIPPVRAELRRLLAERVGPDHPALDFMADVAPALVWYRGLICGEQVDAPALVDELNRYVIDRVAVRPPVLPSARDAAVTDDERRDGARKDAVRNRQRIVAAASNLFAERPYDQVQLEEVASRASLSRATVARHMGTKQQLRLEVYKQRMRDVLDLCSRASAEPDPWKGLELLFRTLATWAADDSGMSDFLRIQHTDVEDPEWNQLGRSVHEALDRVLDRARQADSLRRGISALDVYPLISASVTAAQLQGTHSALYTDILLQGLRPPG